MRRVYVISAKRSPIGSFGGIFKNVSAVELGVQVLKKMLEELSIDYNLIDEVIVGNVVGAGLGMNIARQISIGSGLPQSVPAYSVNKVCGSGMKSVALGASMIQSGDADIIVAGGVENMSQIPYCLPSLRWGSKMGHQKNIDLMINDGLTDVFNNYHMGVTAENLAERHGIERKEMDLYAAESQQKAEKAISTGKFVDEIAPISIKPRKGDPLIITEDEYPRKGVTIESLEKLKPAFKKDGTVTAANSSGINDGSAFVVLISEEKMKALNLKPLAEFVNSASSAIDPAYMGYGPVSAIKKVLKKSDWLLNDIDIAELNEAFAVQSLAVLKGLKEEGVGDIDKEKVNPNGGAIALGHPIGASGTRIIVTLLHELIKQKKDKGLASLCIGGGMGIATLWKRFNGGKND